MKRVPVCFALLCMLFPMPSVCQWKQLGGNEFVIIHSIETYGDSIFVCGQVGVSLSTNAGKSWRNLVASPATYNVNGITFFDGVLYAAGKDSCVRRYRKETGKWENAAPGLEAVQVKDLLAVGETLYAATFDGVYALARGDSVWRPRCTGLEGKRIYSLLRVGTDLYASAFLSMTTVYRSSDGGAHWEGRDSSIASMGVYCLLEDEGCLLAGSYNGVFRSCDNGRNWVACGSDSLNVAVFQLLRSGSTLWACSSKGIFRSSDGGTHWSSDSEGLDDTYVYALAATTQGMFAGGMRLWKRDAMTDAVATPPVSRIREFTVDAPYPNPSKHGPLLTVHAQQDCTVTLTLYATDGRRVRGPLQRTLTPGLHLLTELQDTYATGAYYAVLSTSNASSTVPFFIR
jgi:photosystem II stability/assembly factor-like uncharacterized protein